MPTATFICYQRRYIEKAHQCSVGKSRHYFKADFDKSIAQDKGCGRVPRACPCFVEVEIPVGGKDCHGVEQTDKGYGGGVFDSQANSVLRTGRSPLEPLEEQEEEGTEKRGLKKAIEEDLHQLYILQDSRLFVAINSSSVAPVPRAKPPASR